VESVTEAMVVFDGILVPVIFWPTSAEVKLAVAEEMLGDALVVTPSAEVTRVAVSHSSIPPIVHAGIPVKLTDPALFVIEPPDAEPQMVLVVVS
jgi:hypothetical protein